MSTRARETESTTADDGFHAGSGGEGAAAKDKTRPATPDSTRGGEPDTMGRWFMATILGRLGSGVYSACTPGSGRAGCRQDLQDDDDVTMPGFPSTSTR